MALTNLLRRCLVVSAGLAAAALEPGMAAQSPTAPPGTRATAVSIEGDDFLINGRPTLAGLTWRGHTLEGLLPNSRMVQGVFDDLNPETRGRWAYPDTKTWDPDRNTREFVAAMAEWRRHGLLAITLNLQGGSPEGYSQAQPWHNSAFDGGWSAAAGVPGATRADPRRGRPAGHGRHPGPLLLRPGRAPARRSRRAFARSTGRWRGCSTGATGTSSSRSTTSATSATTTRSCSRRASTNSSRARSAITRGGRRLLVSTSYGGNTLPGAEVLAASDFVLLHGNGVSNPDRIAEMVRQTREHARASRRSPIVFNEDDHYDFDKPWNNFVAATSEHASWGFFDFRRQGEGFDEGYQSVPVNWGISSARKRGFFGLLQEMTGGR